MLGSVLLAGIFIFGSPKSKLSNTDNSLILAPLATPVLAAEAMQSRVHVPILMYHHVGPVLDQKMADLYVSTSDFETQVLYFKNLGYQAVTLKQVYDELNGKSQLPKKPIVFTFDDGYKDVFTNAIPILEKYKFVGSFAIATELLGRPSYAVWGDILSAQRSGMEIVSHTENHLDLTYHLYSDADLHREIFGSKKILEEKLGTRVEFFVYPYGKYNARVIGLLKEAGYKMALTTEYGQEVQSSSLFATPRVRVHGQDGLEKLKKVFEAKRTVSVRTNP